MPSTDWFLCFAIDVASKPLFLIRYVPVTIYQISCSKVSIDWTMQKEMDFTTQWVGRRCAATADSVSVEPPRHLRPLCEWVCVWAVCVLCQSWIWGLLSASRWSAVTIPVDFEQRGFLLSVSKQRLIVRIVNRHLDRCSKMQAAWWRANSHCRKQKQKRKKTEKRKKKKNCH